MADLNKIKINGTDYPVGSTINYVKLNGIVYPLVSDSIEEFEQQIEELTAQNTELESANETLTAQNADLTAQKAEMQEKIWNLQEEKQYYKDEVENLNFIIDDLRAENAELTARIEELESGGGDKSGAYTADGTFSNRVYTWDEMVANFENGVYPNFGKDEDGYILDASFYDVIVPDTVSYAGWLYCKNVVLPATTTRVGWTDNLEFEKIYIKATTPPELESGAFDEMVYSSDPEQLEKFAIVVPIGCGNAYTNDTNWSIYADYIIEGEMPI